MASALDLALRQGAAGLSTGLAYPAAQAAPAAEVEALAKVLARHRGRVYTNHMRDEGDHLLDSVDETIQAARASGARTVISHHKCSGVKNLGKSHASLARIAEAQKSLPLCLDVYPYTASSTALMAEFHSEGPIKVSWSRPYPDQGGRMLDDIARDWGLSINETVDRLSPAGAIYFAMDEDDLQRIIAFPPSMIGSDGIPGGAKPHPRLWGTFPRVLGRYVRELALLPLAEAVHKMTGLSAANFGLEDRGVLAEGYRADITVFDPSTVIDVATFDDSERPSRGITHVFVNGNHTFRDGVQTPARAGRFIVPGEA